VRTGSGRGGRAPGLSWRAAANTIGAFARLMAKRLLCLAAQAQRADQGLIAAFVGLLQVVEQRAALRDQLQQAAARVVVLLVGLEVLGEVGDPFGQDRHLHFGRPGVALGTGVGVDQFGLAFGVIDIGMNLFPLR
jgi:hypothetical protein